TQAMVLALPSIPLPPLRPIARNTSRCAATRQWAWCVFIHYCLRPHYPLILHRLSPSPPPIEPSRSSSHQFYCPQANSTTKGGVNILLVVGNKPSSASSRSSLSFSFRSTMGASVQTPPPADVTVTVRAPEQTGLQCYMQTTDNHHHLPLALTHATYHSP